MSEGTADGPGQTAGSAIAEVGASEPTHALTRFESGAGLTALDKTALREELERLSGVAEELENAQHSANTRRAYGHDVKVFGEWCLSRGTCPLPATAPIVRAFVAYEYEQGKSTAVIMRRMAAIAHHHRKNGYASPIHSEDAGKLRATLQGLRNKHADRKKRKKRAADGRLIREFIATIEGDGLRQLRDRAILAIGMAAAMRRSELVALTPDDIEIVPEGLRLWISKSKTDGEGKGQVIAIPEGTRILPKKHLLAWWDASGIRDEPKEIDPITRKELPSKPLFRRLTRKDLVLPFGMSDKAVERIVKRAAAAAGHAPEDFAGHSLRAGFLTASAATGATIFKMQEVSRHKSIQVLSDYVRDADQFNNHAGSGFM